MKSIHIGFTLALCLLALVVCGQGRPLSFVNYGENAGLRSKVINDMTKDTTGLLWLATNRGLHRFDGYRFKTYLHEAEVKNGLADNHVSAIFIDGKNRLWVGTSEGGVALFDRATERFQNFRNGPVKGIVLSHHQVTGIAENRPGIPWVSTARGYNVWDPAKEQFAIFHAPIGCLFPTEDLVHLSTLLAPAAAPGSPQTKQALAGSFKTQTLAAVREWGQYVYYDREHAYKSLVAALGSTVATDLWSVLENRLRDEKRGAALANAYDNITAIHADTSGNIYLGYENGGIARLRVGGSRPEVLRPNQNGAVTPQSHKVSSLQRVADKLYVGTLRSGLTTLDLETGKITRLEGITPHSLVHNIRFSNGLLYVGTPSGIILYDPEKKQEWHYDNSRNREWDVVDNQCPVVLPDGDGGVWVGHSNHGLSHGTPPQAFTTDPDPARERLPYFLRSVSTALVDSEETLWLGYYEGGIRRLNSRDHAEEGMYLTVSTPRIKRSSIFSIFEDSDGTIWAGGYECGLVRYDPEADDFLPSGIPFARLGGSDVRDLAEDSAGYLWAAVHGFGLTRIDRKTGETQAFSAFGDSPLSPYVFRLAIDDQDRIWMASVQGIYRMEADRRKVVPILTSEDAEPGLFSHRSYEIRIAADGMIWVGTDEGLLALDPEGKRRTDVIIPATLRGTSVKGIEFDPEESGKLWVSQGDKLFNYQPAKGSVFSYELPAHFGAAQFFPGARTKLADGRLAFGYNNGLVSFAPGELHRPRDISRPLLVDLEVFGTENQGETVRLDTTVTSFRLPTNNQGFAVDLSTLYYRNPEAVRYEVRLLPVQENWQRVEGNLPRYTLYRLPPGEHTLEFRASVTNGLGYSDTSRLRVFVPRPWYASPWAFIGYGLLLLGLFLGYRGYVKRRASLQHSLLVSRLKVEHTREVADAKASFFVNVSHELRTPLTLIKGPLRELAKKPEPKADKRQRFYGLMQRNTDRLSELVDRLLDLQKIASRTPELRYEEGDVVGFIHSLVTPFLPRAKAKEINFRTTFPELERPVNYSPEALERICGNLLSNALKFTPEGGEVQLRVLLLGGDTAPQLLIEVEDNGPGIPRDELPHLFERFYRVEGHEQIAGSGVGLSIVKQYTDMVGGELHCESDVGKGTLFRCTLPLAAALVDKATIIEAEEEFLPQKSLKDNRPHLLVVDDDADVRELIRCGCEDDYRITEAGNGATALELARQWQPDLILTDLMMPEMDGIQLCGHLKADNATSHLPVLLLTARHSDDARQEALLAGANDYLTKPFELDFLLQKIQNTLQTLNAARRHWVAEPSALSAETIAAADTDQQFLQTLRQYVEDNMDAPDLDMNALLRTLAVSRSVCYAKVKALTGLPLKAFIKHLRIGRARQLLELTDQPVGDIAYQTGFKTTQHFSRSFREIVGQSPTRFRERKRAELS